MSTKETRGIFGNINYMISKSADAVGTIADAVGTTAQAVDKGAHMLDNLANSGVTLTASNDRLVSISCQGSEMEKTIALYKQFPNLIPEGFTMPEDVAKPSVDAPNL